MKHTPTFEDRALIDMASQQNGNVILDLSMPEAWIAFGMLQLALRHPAIPATTKRATAQITRRLQALIATTPALEELAERGWDPKYDHDPRVKP